MSQSVSNPTAESNLQVYATASVASHYASLDYLTPCERLLFSSYIKRDSCILDLGVGGGRTTRDLASRSSDYVGADYSAAMVRSCQARFPSLEFVVADAADLSRFPDASFDAGVIAFNGVDYIFPPEARRACWRHLHRILKPTGHLIFSSHNPRAVVVRHGWNRERLRQVAERLSRGSKVLGTALWLGLTFARVAAAVVQSTWQTLVRIFTRLPSSAFWRGEGNLVDPVHGGLLTHHWVPERVMPRLATMVSVSCASSATTILMPATSTRQIGTITCSQKVDFRR